MAFNKNIKTDYGAVGDGQVALTTVSITSGTNTLTVTTNIFTSGDVGKKISVPGADVSPQTLNTTIASFVDAKHVTLAVNAISTVSAVQMRLYWGTDDTTAFTNWRTAAQAQGTTPCVLTIPAGVYMNGIGDFWIGVFDLTINMSGATLSEFTRSGPFFQTANTSARLNQVNPGDTVLTLVTSGQTSFFTVGDWVCLSSLDMQGEFGYPPNWVNFEYHQVVAKGSGTITIDSPALYTHKTTYPATSTGVYDTGGPATLFTMTQTWNQTVIVNDGTLDSSGQVQLVAKSLTLNNCTIYGREAYINGNGIGPSCCKDLVFNTCSLPLGVEVDKDITSLTWNNCTGTTLKYQSASITNSYIIGGVYTNITGNGRNMAISGGCTVNGTLTLGCIGYGAPLSFSAANSSFAAINTALSAVHLDLAVASYANGIFSVPNASASALWTTGIPGSSIFWYGTGGGGPLNWGHPAIITDIWKDATNTYVSTIPALPVYPQYSAYPGQTSGTLTTTGVYAHPAVNVTFSNCTGCADAIDLSQSSNIPIYSYTKRTYASDAIGTSQPLTNVWGRITSIKINVTSAASGAGPLHVLGSAGAVVFDTSNRWHMTDMDMQIDLSRTGLRTITPSGISGAGGADSISSLPNGAWIAGGITPHVNAAISGGSVTIEITTEQGLALARGINRWRNR